MNQNFIKTISSQKTLFFFILLSIFASSLNYLTYPILARILPDMQFIDITVALSLITQISAFLLTIVALTIGITKRHTMESISTIEKFQAVLMQIFIIIIVLFLVVSPFLLHSINLSATFLLPICALMLASIPISIISGFFNGKKELIKLAMVAIISAVLQFTFSVFTGFITRNGALALTAMAIAQFIAIFALYRIYQKDRLPLISSVFSYSLENFKTKEMQSLMRFVIFSSLGVMAINILQILDLLVVQHRQQDTKLYTDLYVISRIVFFAGTIFIWPFLANVELKKRRHNLVAFVKLFVIITLLALGSIIVILLFGQQATHILFGTAYKSSAISELGVLAIIYKYQFLLIIALTLFFIVVRNYWAVILPLTLTLSTLVVLLILPATATTSEVLVSLNTIASIGLLFGLGAFFASCRIKRVG